MGLDWEWFLEFLINIIIKEAIKLFLSEIIEYIILSTCGSIDKISTVKFMEVVYVHHEELVVGIFHQ